MRSKTQNEITLRPPPGSRFAVWGMDCVLEFQRGKAREVYNSLKEWLDVHVMHEVLREEAAIAAEKLKSGNPEITALQNHINNPQATAPTEPAQPLPGRVWSTTKIETDEE